MTPLRFDSEEGARDALVAGNPAESRLYQRITSTSKAKRMPPGYAGHDPLTDDQIDIIKRWIEQGAEWRGHWAFEAPQRPAVPAGRNAIDHFITERLKREGLSLEPETLALRRRVEKTMAEIADKKDENAVRRLVAEMNEDIARVNATAIHGPPTNLAPFDVEEILKRWRAGDL